MSAGIGIQRGPDTCASSPTASLTSNCKWAWWETLCPFTDMDMDSPGWSWLVTNWSRVVTAGQRPSQDSMLDLNHTVASCVNVCAPLPH